MRFALSPQLSRGRPQQQTAECPFRRWAEIGEHTRAIALPEIPASHEAGLCRASDRGRSLRSGGSGGRRGGFSPSTAGRLAFRCAFPVAAALKSAPDIRVATAGLPSPFVHFVITRLSRAGSGRLTRSCTAMKWIHHNPRGPRSGPGCSVPVRHHLIDPIRPTRGHTAISPRSGLYAMPSLCGSA